MRKQSGAKTGAVIERTDTQRIYRGVASMGVTDAQAAIIGPALEALAAEMGTDAPQLTPDAIIAAAQPENSPLHRYFEWDDTEAARAYRRVQARHLARAWRVELVIQEAEHGPTTYVLPGLVSVVTDQRGAQSSAQSEALETERRAYVPINDVLARPEYRAQLVADALQRLRYWKDRYETYRALPEFAPLAGVFAEIDRLTVDELAQAPVLDPFVASSL